MPPVTWLLSVAYLCRDVYQNTPVTREMDVLGIHDFRYGTDYGCAYVTPGTVYVCIRGTDSWTDWISNLSAILRDTWYGLRAHRGFTHGARATRYNVMKIVSLHTEKRIVFCGHSRGGAIALLLAIAAEHQYPETIVQCVTFGQPRVSNKSMIRERFHGEYIRVQNGSDFVCRYPKLGYSHGGTCLYIAVNGKKSVNPSQYIRWKDRLFNIFSRYSAHSMNEYIRGLKA